MAQVTWRGPRVSAQIKDAAHRGLQLAGEHLLQVSTARAPLEEGDLARSGAVTDDAAAGIVAVSFDRPYAVTQHEELTFHHAAGKTAKYLEGPMHEEQDTILAVIAQETRRGTRS
jgi:hypothetical protein